MNGQVGGGGPPKRWKKPAAGVALVAALLLGLGWADKEGHVDVSSWWSSQPASAQTGGSGEPPRPPTLPVDVVPLDSDAVSQISSAVLEVVNLELASAKADLQADRGLLVADRGRLSAELVRIQAERGRLTAERGLLVAERQALAAERTRMERMRASPVTRVTSTASGRRWTLEEAQVKVIQVLDWIIDDAVVGSLMWERMESWQAVVFAREGEQSGFSADMRQVQDEYMGALHALVLKPDDTTKATELSGICERFTTLDSSRADQWKGVGAAWGAMRSGFTSDGFVRLRTVMRSHSGLPE